jgi:transposase
MGRQAIALLRQLDAACISVDDLTQATEESFDAHPDAEIISNFPGLGSITGARVLAEIGDDRSRFADAKGLKAFAGAASITRASGKHLAVMAHRVKNQRLASVGYVWAFASLTASPGARAHYDRRRADGDVIPPPSATSSTACSDASTTASPRALSMTRTRPSRPLELLR